MSTFLVDTVTIDDASKPRKTAEGFLVVDARMARTGVQEYLGKELGLNDERATQRFKVNRPPSEVFSADTLKSFAHRTVTLGHPPEMVNDKNWKKYSIGQTGGEVSYDSKFVRVPMVLMDAAAIEAVEKHGVNQLSSGYRTELKWGAGETEDGEAYDATQTLIRANHLAVVPNARGGDLLKIGDDTTQSTAGETEMNAPNPALSQHIVDGVPLMLDAVSAGVIKRALEGIEARVTTLKGNLEEANKKVESKDAELKKEKDDHAETKKTVEKKDGEIAVLTQSVKDAAITPAKLGELVRDRQIVVDTAKLVLGDVALADKTNEDIRKAVVAKKVGEDKAKTMSDAAIEGAFSMLVKDSGAEAGNAGLNALGAAMFDSRPAGGGGFQPNVVNMTDAQRTAKEAYMGRVKDLNDGWKDPTKASA